MCASVKLLSICFVFSTEDGALYKWTAESKTSKQVKQSAVNSLNAQDGYKRTFIKRWILGSFEYVCVVRNKILVFYSGSLVWILFYREC